MCGIFGSVFLGGAFASDERQAFIKQTDLVSYRGPNASGYLTLDSVEQRISESREFDIFLGHRRLAIIGLSECGRQPLTDGKGRWIIFNGEIFNYPELRDELRHKGHQFRTNTDTEVILKIYEEYGEDGFEQLNGMWAFAIVDLPNRRVVLSRDRFSIKPLYYTRQGPKFFFASEIKQLLPFLKNRSINMAVMYTFLVQAICDHSTQTFFEGIYCVEPKHNLIVDLTAQRILQKPYWQYRLLDSLSLTDTVDLFRNVFLDSVRIRLRSDVPLGAMVSGGLDSSTIAIAAHSLGVTLQTYSVVAKDAKYDEGRYVDFLVRDGIRNSRLVFECSSALDDLDTVIWHNDEPFLGFHAVAQFQMFKHIKKATNITVLLSGQGGDECLLGYNKFFFFYLQELLRRGHVLTAARLFAWSFLNGTTVRQFKLSEAKRYIPFMKFLHFPAYIKVRGDLEPVCCAHGLRERQIVDIDRYSVPVQTHFEDRNSMAHSLEVRSPFLDHRLVTLSISLPTSLKLRSGWTKYVLREAFPELPAEIRWRKDKQGFLTPEELWTRSSLRRCIQRTFAGSLLQSLGIIDDQSFLSYYSQFLGGSHSIWYSDISRVLIAERWARIFLN